MRIAQILLPGASHYDRKCQRIDAALPGHEVVLTDDARGFDLAHVYGHAQAGAPVPPREPVGRQAPSPVVAFPPPIPYVAASGIERRWWQRRVQQPRVLVSPLDGEGVTQIPEAVDDAYFDLAPASGAIVGCFLRPSVQAVVDLTLHRLDGIRDDVVWHLFDAPPTPAELSEVAVWVDPAVEENDYDGATAEALAAGRIVVASRTPINSARCEKGRTALLVPPGDPNELTHAILSALFKPESGQQRVTAARQTNSKFRPRQRHRALARLYETLLP
jgi:glycosyltransferase involved in cell wall biosynthesis